MKLATLASAALLLAAPLALAQTSTWKSDPMHSEVNFTVQHLTITNVRGRLGPVHATIHYNSQDVAKSTVQATIDVSAINTGVTPRDNDLKSARFFDVAKYPSATFTSTRVNRSGSGLLVDGNLTIKGITKPVVLHVDGPTATVIGMDKKTHEGFSATTTLDRRAFDLAPAMPNAIVSDTVTLTIDLDVAKQ
ncbi:MAG TPA: YceI family protein [Acidobacteriaceae bacterium]|nr:YceI family protein [Acidobacteriaceae bacterium]